MGITKMVCAVLIAQQSAQNVVAICYAQNALTQMLIYRMENAAALLGSFLIQLKKNVLVAQTIVLYAKIQLLAKLARMIQNINQIKPQEHVFVKMDIIWKITNVLNATMNAQHVLLKLFVKSVQTIPKILEKGLADAPKVKLMILIVNNVNNANKDALFVIRIKNVNNVQMIQLIVQKINNVFALMVIILIKLVVLAQNARPCVKLVITDKLAQSVCIKAKLKYLINNLEFVHVQKKTVSLI
ncbi:hypothetical protein TTHERM_000191329 (macronuclear) [Tetrahymena thermophila SB210]|uniref:Uncharacterized protein n=1 Tax=Tetrahymena thermophila (strain SB210) TaxID=312017 RepID=W7X4J1_TETTS|nr:hypothetical protein TTHERM_000191329 [Tetrahymena thermophila SB210]EWS74255.1 hypothetical protein TTHERM_000191329 [Tetrahymena thermophila SB210]|eukprot:XP_012653228.1 hypothetical protein TTHERM_000191329 [Tetrahymena thermophila SB210]